MRAIKEIEVELGNGEVVYIAVMDNATVAMVAATEKSTLRATRVTLTEEALRELISKLREALHYLKGPGHEQQKDG